MRPTNYSKDNGGNEILTLLAACGTLVFLVAAVVITLVHYAIKYW